MATGDKLDWKIRSAQAEVPYTEFAEWLEANGWTFQRSHGSHRFWTRKGSDALSVPLVGGNKYVKRRYVQRAIKITDQAE